MDKFPEKFYCCRVLSAYSVKCRDKSLEDKNNVKEIIPIGFFLIAKGDFPFLDV